MQPWPGRGWEAALDVDPAAVRRWVWQALRQWAAAADLPEDPDPGPLKAAGDQADGGRPRHQEAWRFESPWVRSRHPWVRSNFIRLPFGDRSPGFRS
jgi:hypothetical protein